MAGHSLLARWSRSPIAGHVRFPGQTSRTEWSLPAPWSMQRSNQATSYTGSPRLRALASTRIDRDEAEALQYNLIRSHASGVGPPLPDALVRRSSCSGENLAQGHSGVRPIVVERLVEMLDRDILPIIPSQGSVGASGDLALLPTWPCP